MLNPRRALVAIASLVLGASCSTERACTLIGADSGIYLSLDHAVLLEEVCLDGECQAYEQEALGSLPFAIDDEPATYEVTLSGLASGGGRFSETLTIDTVTVEPNGPGCEPSVAQAHLLVAADGAVTTKDPRPSSE